MNLYCSKTNTSDIALQKIINSNNLSLINNKEPTYISPASGSTDILDLVLCTPYLALKLQQFTTTHQLSSDHPPIMTTFSLQPAIHPKEEIKLQKKLTGKSTKHI